jgi:hypothetical protein
MGQDVCAARRGLQGESGGSPDGIHTMVDALDEDVTAAVETLRAILGEIHMPA